VHMAASRASPWASARARQNEEAGIRGGRPPIWWRGCCEEGNEVETRGEYYHTVRLIGVWCWFVFKKKVLLTERKVPLADGW
jgi:hypothetical protein